jgi:AcrR family transcriptional regulator
MTPPRAVDARVRRTRRVVLDAAAELLVNDGFERVTIDAIAERSGVARSTVYRNWLTRGELLVDAFAVVCEIPDVPDLGSLEDDFRLLATHLAQGLTASAWGRMFASLIGAATQDAELQAAQTEFNASRLQVAIDLVDRAKARGEVAADADAAFATERFAAGFFFRCLVSHADLDDAFVEVQVAALLRDLGVAR